MFKLYNTYNKAKNVFVKPKLVLRIGFWRNMEGLPFFRHGNIIRLTKYGYYYPNNCVTVKSNDSCFRSYHHKLPKGCENGVWFRNIRKNLRKFRLCWLKPVYKLPLYLSFYIFDFDVCYKLKYDEFRYEFPPQFTIVLFGFAINLTLVPLLEDENDNESNYWECLLNYLYNDNCDKNITKTLNFLGKWHSLDKKTEFFQLRKSHINPKFYDEYDLAVLEYNKNKKYDYDNY